MNSGKLASIAWSFARKYRTTLLAWLIILVFGLLSYNTYLDREGFPAVQLPIAIIQGEYAVGDSTQVDSDVIQPLIKELADIESVDSFNATSFDDRYSVFVSFTQATEIDDGVDELNQAVGQQLLLPDDATITVQSIDPGKFNNKYDLIFAVYDEPSSGYEELQKAASNVAETVVALEGVQITENQDILQDIQIPGTDQTTTLQNGVNFVGVRTDGDIEFYPAINVGVIAEDGTDALELSETVKDSLSDYESSNPETKTILSADFASTINDQIDSLESNLLTGLIAVVAVGWLLISWRAAVVIALFIPTVLAASFIGLNIGGQTLNTITLFSTILTLGLFVDDATIVVEAIEANRKRKRAKEAIITAVKRVGTASLAGTLTTILVFTPMLMVSGILGEFIELLPITVIISLVVSFVVSMTLAPFLSRLFVLPKSNNRAVKLLDRLSLSPLISKISILLARLLHETKSKSKTSKSVATVAILVSLAAIAGGGYLAQTLPLSIFPETKDANQLTATIDASAVSTETLKTSAVSVNSQISDALGNNLEHLSYISSIQDQLSVQIDLTDYQQREITSQELLDKLNEDVETEDEVEVSFRQLDAGPPSEEFPFQMRISGSQPQLDLAVTQIVSFIRDSNLEVNNETVEIQKVEADTDSAIRRSEDGRFRTISAQFDTEELVSGSVAALEDKISVEFDGQRLEELGLTDDALNFDVSLESQNAESFESIQLGLLGALAAMYLLLVLLFNSLSQPLLILMAVPFSIFGVFSGLHLTDNPLSFFVMVGFLGLIGIVVNNSILLVEYANQLRDEGADRWDAISAAVAQRFRPLVTTTTTTVVALLPLAWSDPFWQPLAYTLIFGLISSTMLIIISFPYYYLGLERLRDWKNRRFPQLR